MQGELAERNSISLLAFDSQSSPVNQASGIVVCWLSLNMTEESEVVVQTPSPLIPNLVLESAKQQPND